MASIVDVRAKRIDYRVVGEFKFFPKGADGKTVRPSVVVRIEDDLGRVGFGQAVPIPSWTYETPETIMSTIEGYIGPAIIGCDPADFEELHERMNQTIRPAFSVGQPLCKAAVDVACHDLVAKARGITVSDLLGGAKRDPILLSWTVASPDMETVEKQLEEGRKLGFQHFNIKVGAPQSLAYDIELAKKVRAFAPDCFLWADANTGYTPEEAIEAAPKLADVGVDVLESPLPPARLGAYRALKKQGALPILMDEGILSPVELLEFIQLDMLDGVALKPARNAGLFPSKKIVEILQERELMVLGSGLTDPPGALAATLHLYAWAGIDHPCALNGPQFLPEGFAAANLVPKGGEIEVPKGPGLGVTFEHETFPGAESFA